MTTARSVAAEGKQKLRNYLSRVVLRYRDSQNSSIQFHLHRIRIQAEIGQMNRALERTIRPFFRIEGPVCRPLFLPRAFENQSTLVVGILARSFRQLNNEGRQRPRNIPSQPRGSRCVHRADVEQVGFETVFVVGWSLALQTHSGHTASI